jgi:hypothetical protein
MSTDFELTTAHCKLQALDHAIAELHEKLDHVEDSSEYIDADERRFAVLERLATTRAISPAGLVAKAKAIKAASVADDLDRQAAIAASLTDDVLRYYGSASYRFLSIVSPTPPQRLFLGEGF